MLDYHLSTALSWTLSFSSQNSLPVIISILFRVRTCKLFKLAFYFKFDLSPTVFILFRFALLYFFIYVALVVSVMLQRTLVVVIGGAVVWCCCWKAGSAPVPGCLHRRARRRRHHLPCRPVRVCCLRAPGLPVNAHSRIVLEMESPAPSIGSKYFFLFLVKYRRQLKVQP